MNLTGCLPPVSLPETSTEMEIFVQGLLADWGWGCRTVEKVGCHVTAPRPRWPFTVL